MMDRMTIGEVIDRFSIEQRKLIYGHGNVEYCDALAVVIRGRFGHHDGLAVCYGVRLGILNAEIASLEWQIRAGKITNLIEIGRRAMAIRNLNAQRVETRNAICLVFKEPQTELYYGKGDLKAEDLTLDVQEPFMADNADAPEARKDYRARG